jgi:fermentation-respiration switch protein FrsA (DUF1100 family)
LHALDFQASRDVKVKRRSCHRPIMLALGANAHSRYYSEDVHKAASGPKELVVVPDADHVDLYDNPKNVPFDRFEAFFKQHLA